MRASPRHWLTSWILLVVVIKVWSDDIRLLVLLMHLLEQMSLVHVLCMLLSKSGLLVNLILVHYLLRTLITCIGHLVLKRWLLLHLHYMFHRRRILKKKHNLSWFDIQLFFHFMSTNLRLSRIKMVHILMLIRKTGRSLNHVISCILHRLVHRGCLSKSG